MRPTGIDIGELLVDPARPRDPGRYTACRRRHGHEEDLPSIGASARNRASSVWRINSLRVVDSRRASASSNAINWGGMRTTTRSVWRIVLSMPHLYHMMCREAMETPQMGPATAAPDAEMQHRCPNTKKPAPPRAGSLRILGTLNSCGSLRAPGTL